MPADTPDPSLLLAALLREELWLKFWEKQDNLFIEPLSIDDPEGNVWDVSAVEVPGDGTLRVTTVEAGVETKFAVTTTQED